MDSPLNYVQSLEIASPPPKLREQWRSFKTAMGEDGTQTDAYVDGSSVVSFVGNVDSTARSDVLNSTLLAQLAANKKYDRFKDAKSWYKMYVSVLKRVGWFMSDFLDFKQYGVRDATVRVSDVMLMLIRSITRDPEVEAIQAALDALNSPANTHWYDVYASNSSSANMGNTQILVCNQGSSGELTVGMSGFQLFGISSNERWLWVKYQSAQCALFSSAQFANFNSDVYEKVRQAVIEKLGDNAEMYVGSLGVKARKHVDAHNMRRWT